MRVECRCWPQGGRSAQGMPGIQKTQTCTARTGAAGTQVRTRARVGQRSGANISRDDCARVCRMAASCRIMPQTWRWIASVAPAAISLPRSRFRCSVANPQAHADRVRVAVEAREPAAAGCTLSNSRCARISTRTLCPPDSIQLQPRPNADSVTVTVGS
jgi:hypothetical protein